MQTLGAPPAENPQMPYVVRVRAARDVVLAPDSPHLGVALVIARTWGWHRARRHELAWLTNALLPLLDHPKRDTAQQASTTLTTYLLAVLHGDAPRDEAFETKLRGRKDGFGGPTLEKRRAT